MTPAIITEHGELIGTARIHSKKPSRLDFLYNSQRVKMTEIMLLHLNAYLL